MRVWLFFLWLPSFFFFSEPTDTLVSILWTFVLFQPSALVLTSWILPSGVCYVGPSALLQVNGSKQAFQINSSSGTSHISHPGQ